jgi:putative phosphoribosyl transferase
MFATGPHDIAGRCSNKSMVMTFAMKGEQAMSIEIPAGQAILNGDLHIPRDLRGVVLFAHGSGSSRLSPRNQFVAQVLQDAGMATLLLDLLTEQEETIDRNTAQLRFDVELLAERLLSAIEWIGSHREFQGARVGLFGASTGAAAALIAASESKGVTAVVSRGGRPDLAGDALEHVTAPVLLIVGSLDRTVLNWNRQAMGRLGGEKKLEIVPGATHLFEEPGTLEQVAQIARDWFEQHLSRTRATVHAA